LVSINYEEYFVSLDEKAGESFLADSNQSPYKTPSGLPKLYGRMKQAGNVLGIQSIAVATDARIQTW